ncbi:MAG: hypothetical protein CM15mP130_0600 [Verrucomicrobiota bacterium]|nr:MAG: hypothetical protein CM15mP130_0600 [Verrucomicrobiota bacterium]
MAAYIKFDCSISCTGHIGGKRTKEVHAEQCPVASQTLAGHQDRDIVFYPSFADPTCHIPPLISMTSSVFRSASLQAPWDSNILCFAPSSILGDRSWARIFMGPINVTAFLGLKGVVGTLTTRFFSASSFLRLYNSAVFFVD